MQMDTRIPLMGNSPDLVGQFQRGQQAGQFGQDAAHQNAFRAMMQEQGPGIVAGDQNALAQMARFDAPGAVGIQSQQQGMRISEEKLQMAYQQANRQAQQHAMGMSAAERQMEAQKLERALAAGTQIQSPEQWDAMMTQMGMDQLVGQFENRQIHIASALGVKDALGMGGGGEGPAAFQTLEMRARAAGLQPGTPEYQQFMMAGGSQSGLEIVQGPDGSFTFRQGPGVTSSGPAPDVSPAAPSSGAGDQFRNAPDAFGAGSVLRGAANRVADVVSGQVPFPETLEAQRDFAVFGEGLINAFASAYGRQPPSWLLRNIEGLTPKQGSLFEGPQQAQSKLRSISRELRQRREGFAAQLESSRRVSNREDLVAQISGIDATLLQLNAAMEGFAGQSIQLAPEVEDILRLYE